MSYKSLGASKDQSIIPQTYCNKKLLTTIIILTSLFQSSCKLQTKTWKSPIICDDQKSSLIQKQINNRLNKMMSNQIHELHRFIHQSCCIFFYRRIEYIYIYRYKYIYIIFNIYLKYCTLLQKGSYEKSQGLGDDDDRLHNNNLYESIVPFIVII